MGARRTTGVVAGVLSVGAVAAAITIFNLPDGTTEAQGSTTPPPTAEITRQTLVDREDHDGTLGHGDTTTISARGEGTVTAMAAQNTILTRGKALYRLDNKPVTLLYGSLPAYRTLSPGVKGADVKQFERNLWALGYRGFTVDNSYTSSTASAVKEWQDDLGLTKTGTVDPGQISYATGPVRIDSLSSQTGAVVQPGTALEKITGTALLATVELDTDSQRLVKQGAAVQVTLPDGTVVGGKITKYATVVSPGQNGEPDTTKIEVTIAFSTKPKGLDAAAVTVSFTAGQRANVLTVPVGALLALAEGGYGVQVADGSATRIVAVETGLFASGRVEITGDGLQAGTKVVVPS